MIAGYRIVKNNISVSDYPNYNSFGLIRDKIVSARNYLSIQQLHKLVCNKIADNSFEAIIDYLINTKKVFISKDNKVIWTDQSNNKTKKLIKESVPYV